MDKTFWPSDTLIRCCRSDITCAEVHRSAMLANSNMTVDFFKMNGAGNDFVVVDNRSLGLGLTGTQIAFLCDRHRGVGADGVLAVEPAQHGADFRMRYYNADGGEAEMCGNGARCFARFARPLIGDACDSLSFETQAGVITAAFYGDQVQLGMSDPHGFVPTATLMVNDRSIAVDFLNTGVPHAVVTVTDLAAVDVRADGAALRNHVHFSPQGTNVNFMQVDEPGKIRIRTYERGVEDETLACGTGVVACALIHHIHSGAESPIAVQVKGGDTMVVGFEIAGSVSAFDQVTLTGPADIVFRGTILIP